MIMSLRCRSCNIAFHDNASLEVHYQYAHSNGDSLPDTSRPAELDGESAAVVAATESNNNNFFKFHNVVQESTSPGNGPDSHREFHLPTVAHHHPARELMYEIRNAPVPGAVHPNYDGFMMNTQEYVRSSPHNSGGSGYAFNEQRYHPYYKQGFRELPRQMLPAQPMQQCDKCEFQCTHPDLMIQHYNMAHNLGVPSFSLRFGNPPVNGGAEPQAEILDLDSHKVHVYQPPNGEDSQDSDHRSMDPWAHDEKKYFQQQQQPPPPPPPPQQQLQVNQNGATNGRGGTPLPSPDFGNVSTTTDNIENLQSSTRSPYYEQNSGVNSTPTQISSTDNPNGRSSSKGGKNSNGTWKSNEARRPKTYNCSACNKWFTSSGHLKRHYNTTLHKNAVKQSGAPDPATLPVSAHHHPQKDPSFSSSRQVKNSPPVAEPETPPAKLEVSFARNASQIATAPPAQQQSANSGFLHNSPNLMAGPSEVPGGLLHPSYTQSPEHLIKSPSPITALPPHSSHSNYLPFGATQPQHTTLPFFQQATPTTLYPNFQSPHVSTTRQVTTNNPIGNVTETLNDSSDSKLPSFACIQKNVWNQGSLDQFFSSFDNAESNVGGPFTPKEVETTTEMLLKNLALDKSPFAFTNISIKCEPVDGADASGADIIAPDLTSPPPPPAPQQEHQQQPQAAIEESDVSSSTERTSPVTPVDDFRCPICNKIFNKACYLTQHNKSFHSGDRPYKCTRCGKRYQNSELYSSHWAKHSGDKPHKCEMCPKAFNHKTDLRRHACLHTDHRPFTCDICLKGFIRKDHMLKHRETHQNRKTAQRRFRVVKVKKEFNLQEVAC